MSEQQLTWQGDEERPVQTWRPCPCGCDLRDGAYGVGYLSGSTPDGRGFSIWIEDEEVYQAVQAVLGGEP